MGTSYNGRIICDNYNEAGWYCSLDEHHGGTHEAYAGHDLTTTVFHRWSNGTPPLQVPTFTSVDEAEKWLRAHA